MLADARPRVLLTEEAILPAIPLDDFDVTERPAIVRIDADWPDVATEPVTPPEQDADAASLAYVMYTSGSTGTPKGVAAVHRGVVRLVSNPTYVRLGPDETLLSFAPLTFDASTLELWGALCTGGRLVIFPGQTPSLEELADVIAANGVTTLWLTAALFHQFVDGHLEGLRPLRQLLAGGDVLSVPHVRRVLESLPECTLINGYGPTENTTFTCCHPMRGPATVGASVPIGRPIGNTTVYILDDWMEPVPWGVPGRLYTGGDGLARGYLGRADLTAERFRPDPFDASPDARIYDTGDLARWRADGTVEFLGRADTQLKIRGFRIEPGEVEAALLAEASVKEAVVVGREDERGGKRLVAYVVPEAGVRIDGTALRFRLAERLPDYLVPSLVVTLDALPLTASGKVDRRALPDPVAASHVEDAPPRDDVERVVARTWEDALGHAPRSVHAGFFDLGGDSLLAIRIVAQLHKVFRVRLPLRRFFDDPTVAGVARSIAAAEAKPGQAAAIAALLLRIQQMTPQERERLRRENASPDQPNR
jgi:aspartate racemase